MKRREYRRKQGSRKRGRRMLRDGKYEMGREIKGEGRDGKSPKWKKRGEERNSGMSGR